MKLDRIRLRDSGQGLAEYSVVIVVIAVVCMAAFMAVGDSVLGLVNLAGGALSS